MRRFIIKTAIFLVLAALIAAGIEAYIRSWDNSYKAKDRWMTDNAATVETIILGNSHALFSFRPQYVGSNAYNLANVSQTIDYDNLLLRHYAPMCKRLKNVIITVDNSNLFDPSLDEIGAHRATFYRIYMGIRRHSLLSEYSLELLHPATVQAKWQKHMRHEDMEIDSAGWCYTYKADQRDPSQLDDESVRQRAEGHICGDWRLADYNARELLDIAEYCKKNRLRLTIVQTPTCKKYNLLIPVRQQRFIDSTLDKCRRLYGATVVNLHDSRMFSDSDFFDADHITDRAAARLSTMVGKMMQR
ncbi:MAG: hypothetical protein J6M54_05230 [Prevotella sp.]|nr:hypothetical protein [Prevotella sp.]